MSPFRQARELAGMIKLAHSLFALPFAFTAMLLAADGLPRARVLILIVLCMVTARTAAMTWNRIADRRIDALNPRTKDRSLPAGRVSERAAWSLLLFSSVLFVLCAAAINRLTLILSPVALLIVLSYSLAKRVTPLTHWLLGLALGVAPAGAWIAVRGSLDLRVVLLSIAVMLWTAGFDVLYACQDVDFDREQGLHSTPARLGVSGALWVARLSHAAAIAALFAFGLAMDLGWPWLVGTGIAALLLAWSHALVSASDLSRVGVAFFQVNVGVSLAVMGGAAGAVWLR